MERLTKTGWLGVAYEATPKVGQYYIDDDNSVKLCVIPGQAFKKTIVKRVTSIDERVTV